MVDANDLELNLSTNYSVFKIMKIYFAGSIRGEAADKETFHKIIAHLKKYGKVLTAHVGDPKMTDAGEFRLSDEEIYERDIS